MDKNRVIGVAKKAKGAGNKRSARRPATRNCWPTGKADKSKVRFNNQSAA